MPLTCPEDRGALDRDQVYDLCTTIAFHVTIKRA